MEVIAIPCIPHFLSHSRKEMEKKVISAVSLSSCSKTSLYLLLSYFLCDSNTSENLKSVMIWEVLSLSNHYLYI